MREEGVTVDRSDPNAWTITEPTAGVVADRDFSTEDFNETRGPPPPTPELSVCRVEEPVFGDAHNAAGVHLPAGGSVIIGPGGSIRAQSGIAILATRPSGGEAPMRHVDIALDGHQVAEVIGDDWIINDGGETMIVVNGVTLHDGVMGTTGLTARNGAWNVTIRAEGVTVDRSARMPG